MNELQKLINNKQLLGMPGFEHLAKEDCPVCGGVTTYDKKWAGFYCIKCDEYYWNGSPIN
jgi:hypothetical protein